MFYQDWRITGILKSVLSLSIRHDPIINGTPLLNRLHPFGGSFLNILLFSLLGRINKAHLCRRHPSVKAIQLEKLIINIQYVQH